MNTTILGIVTIVVLVTLVAVVLFSKTSNKEDNKAVSSIDRVKQFEVDTVLLQLNKCADSTDRLCLVLKTIDAYLPLIKEDRYYNQPASNKLVKLAYIKSLTTILGNWDALYKPSEDEVKFVYMRANKDNLISDIVAGE